MTDVTNDPALALFRHDDGRLYCDVCGEVIAPEYENESFAACGVGCLNPSIVCPSEVCFGVADARHNEAHRA